MKLVLISDTHTFHNQISPPSGDVLVHAGDLSLSGSNREVQEALDWLNMQPFEDIVCVAGNHDWACEKRLNQLDFGRICYLENSSINIKGKIFYGSPVQPWFCSWAFNVHRGKPIKEYWDKIPESGVDVLITHGPPMGILDQAWGRGDHLGCADLMDKIENCKPAINVFGHIHGGYGEREINGSRFFNASVVDESYKVANKPFVVEI